MAGGLRPHPDSAARGRDELTAYRDPVEFVDTAGIRWNGWALVTRRRGTGRPAPGFVGAGRWTARAEVPWLPPALDRSWSIVTTDDLFIWNIDTIDPRGHRGITLDLFRESDTIDVAP